MEKHTEFAAMMNKPLTPAERILVQLASGTANESPAGAVLMRLSVDEAADLETIIQEHGALSSACQTIPTEALTPGSVQALVEAAEAALVYDKAIQGYAPQGNSWVQSNNLDALYEAWISKSRAAIAPFKDAQEVKPNVVSG